MIKAAAPTDYDILVVGSGIAGLSAALTAAASARVAVVTKGALDDGCSRFAQGGIAAAVGDDDSPELHFEDTMVAGRGLCHPDAVRALVEEGPARIRQLIEWGVAFDTQDGELLLAQEAAHSRPRILHARGDGTGLEVETALIRRLRASGARVVEHADVTAILTTSDGTCCGVSITANGTPPQTTNLTASAVVLASGGASRLWRNSTNPKSATGDGVALGYQAGAEIAGMEFAQFHPTALAMEGAPRFLISEAVRGEGALIVNRDGHRFVLDADPRGELAGRDVVARAIWDELGRSGERCVYLDCSPLGDRAAMRFPTIAATCAKYGVNIAHDPIPVAPAAHYMIGGVRTDLDGATTILGLYACGEVAHSGVHGANRLASNSLLESLVFSRRAAHAALGWAGESPPADAGSVARPSAPRASTFDAREGWNTLHDALWSGAGVVRDAAGLQDAGRACTAVATSTAGATGLSMMQLHAAASTASLVCTAALAREESRGCHLRSDLPQASDQWHGDFVMHKDRGARFDRHL
ncbi:MAG: L-aspartate oxidase [Candidatus Dormiibacterota bacterium]